MQQHTLFISGSGVTMVMGFELCPYSRSRVRDKDTTVHVMCDL